VTIRGLVLRRDAWRGWGLGWSPLALALVLAVVQIIGTHLAAHWQTDRKPFDAVAAALLVAGPLALIGKRRYPVAVLWAVSGIALLFMLLGYPYGPVLLSVIVALYAAVMTGHRLAAWLAAAGLYVGHFLLRFLLGQNPAATWTQALGVAAGLVLVLVVCEALRVRRERLLEAERTHREEARRRASEERLSIARELHDVLAHHISMINVQASVALHLMERKPEQARIALTAIEAASREAMGELRSVLTILNRPDEPPPLTPAPSLSQLDRLVGQAAAAGIDVRTRVEGAPRPLPAPVDAAAFRIVQESLTNVVRHAHAATATVQICYGPHDLSLRIEDDGEGGVAKPLHGGGNGIPGMRERVTALGGELEAGRLPGRGFRVHARLPEDGAR
jgi:signal transduction histidine kinase